MIYKIGPNFCLFVFTSLLCGGAETASVHNLLVNQPLRFEAASDPRDGFHAAAANYRMTVSPTRALITGRREADNSLRLEMNLEGANRNAASIVDHPLPGASNYFIGNDHRRWRRSVPAYSKVTYRGVYPGIDVAWYGQGRNLEYDFIVQPGADAKAVRLNFKGQRSIAVDREGALLVQAPGVDLRHHKPVAYQEDGNRRVSVPAKYVWKSGHEIGFEVWDYDRRLPLYIDPVIEMSTYLGGSGAENPTDITLDARGNIYVTGPTNSKDFPIANPLQGELKGGLFDCFVSKFSPDGSRLIYSTFFGGSSTDDCRGIAVDLEGNAFVSGLTLSPDLPLVNPLQRDLRGPADGMLFRISPDGSQLVFATYLGGSGFESANRVKLDVRGNVYMIGETASADFPVTAPLRPSFSGGESDSYLVKLQRDGQRMIYGTYLGGSGADRALGLAVDLFGNAYVTGETNSVDFPTERPIQHALKRFTDTYVSKVRADGQAFVFSTYLGGSDNELASGLTVDWRGDVYVAGRTASADFPTVNAYQSVAKGFDAFVAKLRSDGAELIYSTFLGGSGQDQGLQVAVDIFGFAYIVGQTRSPDFPTANAVQPQYGGGTADAFVAKLSPRGENLLFSTYLGGTDAEEGRAVIVDLFGTVYATGTTTSPDFPVKAAYQERYSGFFNDGFVVKIPTQR